MINVHDTRKQYEIQIALCIDCVLDHSDHSCSLACWLILSYLRAGTSEPKIFTV